jgi:hypothetical protein
MSRSIGRELPPAFLVCNPLYRTKDPVRQHDGKDPFGEEERLPNEYEGFADILDSLNSVVTR